MRSTTIGPVIGEDILVTDFAASVAVQATGCVGAGSYLAFAKEHGYLFIETVDWSSSAGDWTFAVSEDGHEWRVLCQENNYPRLGFSHYLGSEIFFGTAEEVLTQIYEDWGYA